MFEITKEDSQRIDQIIIHLKEIYEGNPDPWGLDIELAEIALRKLTPIYRNYFKVRLIGAENIPNVPFIVISNHSGQIPIDAMLITMAFLLDSHSPILLRAMVERFMGTLPFINKYASALGAVLGDRNNAYYLIEKKESLLVFPEGVKGISKNSNKFYQLQDYTTGFYRMAQKHSTSILPIAVVGAEEMYPFVIHFQGVANFFKIPALPLSLNILPLPSPIDIYIGNPYTPSAKEDENKISQNVLNLEMQTKKLILQGLAKRRPFFDFIRKPISQFLTKDIKKK